MDLSETRESPSSWDMFQNLAFVFEEEYEAKLAWDGVLAQLPPGAKVLIEAAQESELRRVQFHEEVVYENKLRAVHSGK